MINDNVKAYKGPAACVGATTGKLYPRESHVDHFEYLAALRVYCVWVEPVNINFRLEFCTCRSVLIFCGYV